MTTAEARTLAQSDPVPNLSREYGDLASAAKAQIDRLTATLRTLDKVKDHLVGHGITVDVDLGPIGNAAAAARRDLEKQRDTPTFELPR